VIEEMAKGIDDVAKGTDEGSNMFRQILTLRLKEFGGEEIEDTLDAFVASQEYEAEEADKARKESEGLQILDQARGEFKDVFDGLKKELEELKEESAELREELDELKQCGMD
jgi:predicted RNase H-like nuclease (RuvC/YqgF family)